MYQPTDEDVIRDYCLHHELSRPYINKTKVLIIMSFVFVVVGVVSYALCLLADTSFFLFFELIIGVLAVCYAKKILIFLIHCYQRYATDKTRRQCSCMPSCSEYALLALDKYIWPKALWKIWRRVTHTCSMPGYHIDYP
ncbi:MAG: membrane protein insertion efficiency factor YidD [Prevotellaceae bacterium]|nr:membrane protein insertion efficiency factor YidD [Candidatus Faecinaster equi]